MAGQRHQRQVERPVPGVLGERVARGRGVLHRLDGRRHRLETRGVGQAALAERAPHRELLEHVAQA